MTHDYTLYSMMASMYSGKIRGLMNYKRLNYHDKSANIIDLNYRLKARTGESVLPVLKTRDGEWIQDTTIIAEELERRHPEPAIGVSSPVQYAAALLLEAWGDEYWLPIAMHQRWSYKQENKEFLFHDVGASALPGFPRFLQRMAADLGTRRLDTAGPVIGFVPEQRPLLDAWSEAVLDELETHFAAHDYLLGGRPTIADFSLLASFYGHLNRDPSPKRRLMEPRPALTVWVERTQSGARAQGDIQAGDAIPETLMPILTRVFGEFFAMVESYRAVLEAHLDDRAAGPGYAVPRFLGLASFPMQGRPFKRAVMPYTLWMMQRAQAKIEALSEDDQDEIEDWMQQGFGRTLSQLDLGPQLVRTGLSTQLA